MEFMSMMIVFAPLFSQRIYILKITPFWPGSTFF